jgi:hypothetical protein
MTRRQLPPPAPATPPAFDLDATLAELRDEVARADTMLGAIGRLIVDTWRDSPDATRNRQHVSYLLEAAEVAVREAIRLGNELDLHQQRSRR